MTIGVEMQRASPATLPTCPLELKTSRDVHDLIELYNACTPGVGLGRMREWVAASALPYDVKRRFLVQYARGMLFPKDFL